MKDLVDESISIISGDRDIAEFGELMHEGWLTKRTLSANISNPDVDELSYLDGKSFELLIKAEAEATQLALTDAGKPNVAHHFPAVNAYTLGQFYYLLEMQTAIAGELYNINAFDQPGVEAGKIATYALMGRAGYDERRHEIEQARERRNESYVI